MAGNAKPRKRHKPRPYATPVTIRFGAEDEQTLQVIPHVELLKLRTNEATAETWHCLVCRLNIGLVLANRLFHQDVIDAVAKGLDAMREIAKRHDRVGKYGGTAEEIAAIGEGLAITDGLQARTTRREIRDALAEVYRVATV